VLVRECQERMMMMRRKDEEDTGSAARRVALRYVAAAQHGNRSSFVLASRTLKR